MFSLVLLVISQNWATFAVLILTISFQSGETAYRRSSI